MVTIILISKKQNTMYCEPCTKHPFTKRKLITEEMVIDKTCEYLNVPKSKVLSKDRHSHIAEARQIICHILRNDLKYTYIRIKEVMNYRDHTTAIHSVELVNGFLQIEPHFLAKYVEVKLHIGFQLSVEKTPV